MRLRHAAAQDDQVLIDDAGRSECDRLLAVVTAEALSHVDAALLAKTLDGSAVARIECVEKVCDAGKEALLRTVCPPGEAANGLCAGHTGIEGPLQLAGCRVQRDDFLRWC